METKPVMGVNVHAQVAIPARDRARLERLCRYVCRPPIAEDRLEQQASGKLRYTLKKAWKDGTVALLLEPLDSIARVCALVPPPRQHMVAYHGVLSSHAKLRSEVVPAPDASTSPARVVQLELFDDDADHDDAEPADGHRLGCSATSSRWTSHVPSLLRPDALDRGRHGPRRDREAARQARARPQTSADEVRSAGAAAPRVPEDLSEPGRREMRHGGAPSAAADRGSQQHRPTKRRSVHAAPGAPNGRTGGTCGGGSADSAALLPVGIPYPPRRRPSRRCDARTGR